LVQSLEALGSGHQKLEIVDAAMCPKAAGRSLRPAFSEQQELQEVL
jgi:hypothetical protein